MCRVIACFCFMVLSGCLDGAGPAAEVGGVWTASAGPFGMTLELAQRGEAVTGTGASYAFSSPTSVTFAIAGTYFAPHLALTFTRDTLLLAEFDGTVLSGERLVGVETFVNGADTLTFVRQH